MPYIKQVDREELTIKHTAANAGQLNYVITTAIQSYLNRLGHSYSSYNEVIGVLECAKLELYRRKISPYEDSKIEENGDVY